MYESLNIDLLYVFTTVAELKSINKSSDVLLLSQPAISKKIKQLEDYFGKKLFIRSPRGMALTPAGELFIANLKKLSMILTRSIIWRMINHVQNLANYILVLWIVSLLCCILVSLSRHFQRLSKLS